MKDLGAFYQALGLFYKVRIYISVKIIFLFIINSRLDNAVDFVYMLLLII
jgi:hypothetical protein